MKKFIYKPLEEYLNNKTRLEEKLPFEISRAYKNYKDDINNQASDSDKLSIPSFYKYNSWRSEDGRIKTDFDLGKAEYNEISKEKALELIKDKANLNSNLSKMVFLFDLGSPYSQEKRYKIVRYNDNGNQIVRINFEKYNLNIYYENALGKRIYKTSSWPLKALISLSNKIYLTNDKDLKIDTRTIKNPEADVNDRELETNGYSYYAQFPFIRLDSKGQPYDKGTNLISNKRNLNSLGYGEEDTGNHRNAVKFKNYLKVSDNFNAEQYRYYLKQLKRIEDHYGTDISSYSSSVLSEYKYLKQQIDNYQKRAKDIFDSNKRDYDELHRSRYLNVRYDTFMAQANLNKLKGMKKSLDDMDKSIKEIKNNTANFNDYSRALENLKYLDDKKKSLEQQLADLETKIKQVNTSYTAEDKEAYEAEIEAKTNELLDKYEDYMEKMNSMRKKYLKEDMDGIKLIILDEKKKLSREEIDALIKDEEEAIDNYENALTETDDIEEINLIKHIIEEEKEHILELQGLNQSKNLNEGKNPKATYMYEGPIWYQGKIVSYHWEDQTQAVSEKQAINNLRYKAGKHIGFDVGTHQVKVEIEPKSVIKVENDDDCLDDILNFESPKRCDKCNTLLNDGGTCPVCDDGEEDY